MRQGAPPRRMTAFAFPDDARTHLGLAVLRSVVPIALTRVADAPSATGVFLPKR